MQPLGAHDGVGQVGRHGDQHTGARLLLLDVEARLADVGVADAHHVADSLAGDIGDVHQALQRGAGVLADLLELGVGDVPGALTGLERADVAGGVGLDDTPAHRAHEHAAQESAQQVGHAGRVLVVVQELRDVRRPDLLRGELGEGLEHAPAAGHVVLERAGRDGLLHVGERPGDELAQRARIRPGGEPGVLDQGVVQVARQRGPLVLADQVVAPVVQVHPARQRSRHGAISAWVRGSAARPGRPAGP